MFGLYHVFHSQALDRPALSVALPYILYTVIRSFTSTSAPILLVNNGRLNLSTALHNLRVNRQHKVAGSNNT